MADFEFVPPEDLTVCITGGADRERLRRAIGARWPGSARLAVAKPRSPTAVVPLVGVPVRGAVGAAAHVDIAVPAAAMHVDVV